HGLAKGPTRASAPVVARSERDMVWWKGPTRASAPLVARSVGDMVWRKAREKNRTLILPVLVAEVLIVGGGRSKIL
ncbi:MAG TPA: hypothetical protein PLL20_19245, partial [Phycisphaerae bacterium]|nr:hypothetical protein [Phycisphaerae bacterium]